MTDETRKFLSREEILAVPDIQTEEVHVPEWGGWIHVRGLTGTERDEFESSLMTGNGKKQKVTLTGARAKLCSLSIVDDTGKRIFSQADIQNLGRKSASALSRVFDRAAALSGLTEEDLEEMTENFDETAPAASGSD